MASAVIQADTHVFGSTSGYKTVAASRGVRDDEKRELESFQFGEASTADRIARLETHAVMTGRALRSGRFAISRMMPAGVDDAGRPTIEVITLIVEPRDYVSCIGSLELFAADPGFWRAARSSAAAGTAVPARAASADPRDPQVLRVFDLWRAAVRFGALGVVPEAQSSDVFRLVASLDPSDRARCRWGIGLLSVAAPADICSLASGTSTHGARDVMRPAPPGTWHCGSETEYAALRVSGGLRSFPTVADVEQNGRSVVVEAGQTEMRAPTRTAVTRPAPRERRLMPFAIGSAVLSTVVLGLAITMYAGRRLDPRPAVSSDTNAPNFTEEPSANGGGGFLAPKSKKPDTAGSGGGGASVGEGQGATGSQIDEMPSEAVGPPPKSNETGESSGEKPVATNPAAKTQDGDSGSVHSQDNGSMEPPIGQEVSGGNEGSVKGDDSQAAAGASERPTSQTQVVTENASVSEDAAVIRDAKSRLPKSPIRIPSPDAFRDDPPQQPGGLTAEQKWKRAVNDRAQQASDDSAACVSKLITLVDLDRKLKQKTKNLQPPPGGSEASGIDGVPASLLETNNGFICTLTMDQSLVASHRNGPQFLLQRALVREWVDFLEALAASMPTRYPKSGSSDQDRAATAVAEAWNKGVEDAIKKIKAIPPVESVAKKLLIVDQYSGNSGTAEYPSEGFQKEVHAAKKIRNTPLE
jgi:hypothetical protein